MPAAPRDLSASGTLYSVLGVTPSASAEEIRRAYRSLARRLHPDSRRSEKGLRAGAAAAEFSIVSEAFEVLNDEVRRDMYDSIGLDGLRFYEWVQKIGPAGPKAALPPVVCLRCRLTSRCSRRLCPEMLATILRSHVQPCASYATQPLTGRA